MKKQKKQKKKFSLSQRKKILKTCFDEGKEHCTSCKKIMSFPKFIDPMNKTYNHLDKDAAQVDHVYPKSLGGKAALWNAQVLCRGCNEDKGNLVNSIDSLNYHRRNISNNYCTVL